MMISKNSESRTGWVPNGVWIFDPSETQFAGLRDVDADSTGSLSCSLGHDGPWGHNNKNVEFDGIWMPTMGYIHVYTPKWMEETMENLSVHGWCGVTAILTKPPYSDIEPGTHGNFPRHFGRKNSNIRLSETKFTKNSKRPSHTCTDIEWYVFVLVSYCPIAQNIFDPWLGFVLQHLHKWFQHQPKTRQHTVDALTPAVMVLSPLIWLHRIVFSGIVRNDLYYRFLEHVDLPEHLKWVTYGNIW